jgi:hypothetical protein
MEMVTDGFFARWIPEVVDMQMEQDPVHRDKDVLTHTVAVTASTPQLRLRFAAWMHDIGKPASGEEIMDLLGIAPGPAVGAAIAMLLAADPPLDRTGAEQQLRSWWMQRTSAVSAVRSAPGTGGAR